MDALNQYSWASQHPTSVHAANDKQRATPSAAVHRPDQTKHNNNDNNNTYVQVHCQMQQYFSFRKKFSTSFMQFCIKRFSFHLVLVTLITYVHK